MLLRSRSYRHLYNSNLTIIKRCYTGLSKSQINDILHKHQSSSTLAESVVRRIDCSAVPSNSPMEDTHFQTILKDGSICLGICDGHWSYDCAKLVAYALPHYIEKYVCNDRNTSFSTAFEQLDADICDLPWRALTELSETPEYIRKMDPKKKLSSIAQCYPSFAGACAIAANIHGNNLHIAHAGDCRAILGICKNGNWKSKPLTQDHQASNRSELSRLHAEHPGEEDSVIYKSNGGPMRVLGVMMPSRAFGDARFKWSIKKQDKIDALLHGTDISKHSLMRPPNLYTPPYITATPETVCIPLDSDVSFLILASDGILEIFSNDELVNGVVQYLDGRAIDDNAATHLIRLALEAGKGANSISKTLAMPPSLSRQYRDDMTVQVVFFNSMDSQLPSVISNQLQRCSG